MPGGRFPLGSKGGIIRGHYRPNLRSSTGDLAELGQYAAAMVIDERSCIRCGICVDWCPTECLTMDHFRLTPAEPRESVDLAIVAD